MRVPNRGRVYMRRNLPGKASEDGFGPSRLRYNPRAAMRPPSSKRSARRTTSPRPTRPGNEPKALLAARAGKILDLLEEAHPEATCALHHRNPYELVTAVILSAQC